MANPQRKTNGFTLAEAMIAMVILATAAAAVSLPFSAGAAAHSEGAKQTVAAQLAAELLERLKNESFDMLWIYDGYVESKGSLFDANWQIYTDPAYSRFWRRTTCTDALVGGRSLKWVTAYVHYDDNEVLRMSALMGP